MLIPLDNKYRIKGDSRQYVLQRKAQKKSSNLSSEDSWTDDGYFMTLQSVLSTYAERALRESDVDSLREAVDFMEATHKRLESLLKPPFKGT